MQPLFVYGTLLFPEVLKMLLGRIPRRAKAVLTGYRRCSIHDGPSIRLYPAIFPEEQAVVEGELLLDLSAAERQVLDAYEGADYLKVQVQVYAEGQSRQAEAYVWQMGKRGQLRGDWDPEYFKTHHLQSYLGHLS